MKARNGPLGKLDCLYSKKKRFQPRTAASKPLLGVGRCWAILSCYSKELHELSFKFGKLLEEGRGRVCAPHPSALGSHHRTAKIFMRCCLGRGQHQGPNPSSFSNFVNFLVAPKINYCAIVHQFTATRIINSSIIAALGCLDLNEQLSAFLDMWRHEMGKERTNGMRSTKLTISRSVVTLSWLK